MRKIYTIIAFFCLLAPIRAAWTPSNLPNPQTTASAFVCNPDGLLSPQTVVELNRLCRQLQQQTEAELAIVAVQSIGDADAADFAQQLFRQWGIGRADRNTGILLLLATDSRDIRIHTGGGIEGLLPDATCERILQERMMEPLGQGLWDAGILAGTQAICTLLSSDDARAEILLGFTPATSDLSDALCTYLAIGCLALLLLSLVVYKDTQPLLGETPQQRIQRQTMGWSATRVCAFLFPLPVLFLAWWYYRHGGKAIQATLNEAARKQREALERERRNHPQGPNSFGSGGFFIGGGGHRSGGFGGGFGGGSFGGGTSFGGGAGGKF